MSEIPLGAWLEAIAAHHGTESPARTVAYPPLRLADNALTTSDIEVLDRVFAKFKEDEK